MKSNSDYHFLVINNKRFKNILTTADETNQVEELGVLIIRAFN